ncbi:MAG TPA: trypsin-like serine protease [Kofleriaceae bacterium]|nr:trypsin-like serine protease [Kofleriaceae bacterium]
MDSTAQDDGVKSGTDDQPIIGGTTDTGDPCVVAVFARTPGATSGSLCTGTIIGPHTVLTAAHCTDPAVIGAGQEIDILTGTTLTGPAFLGSSATFNPAWNPNNLAGCHDEGIVHTSATLSPVCSVGSLNSAAQVRLVGYGTNTHANTGAQTKRQVTVSIDSFSVISFKDGNSNTQTCHGDSGGPAFQGANVVGITSFGTDPSPTDVCEGGGTHCRADIDLGFILANRN